MHNEFDSLYRHTLSENAKITLFQPHCFCFCLWHQWKMTSYTKLKYHQKLQNIWYGVTSRTQVTEIRVLMQPDFSGWFCSPASVSFQHNMTSEIKNKF